MYNAFKRKHSYLKNPLNKPLKYLFYNLHFFVLIYCVYYDIRYNEYVLILLAKILPLLFIYQIYIFLSFFVYDKILYNTGAEIHSLYYDDQQEFSPKAIFINGELFQKPDYEKVIMGFLRYEAAEFYWTRIKH